MYVYVYAWVCVCEFISTENWEYDFANSAVVISYVDMLTKSNPIVT